MPGADAPGPSEGRLPSGMLNVLGLASPGKSAAHVEDGENRLEPLQSIISFEDTITATAEHHQGWPTEAGGN